MRDDQTVETKLIYDGSYNPNVLTNIVNNLITGNSYTFTLVALNFNGEGQPSNPVTFKTCTVPSTLSPPVVT